MAGSAPIDQILATQWPTAIGACAGGIASDVNSISASGSCSANSSMVSGRSCGCHTTSPTAPGRPRDTPEARAHGVGRARCRGRRSRSPTAVVPRASAQLEPAASVRCTAASDSVAVARPADVHASGTAPLCPATSTGTTPSPIVRAIVRPKAARRISSAATPRYHCAPSSSPVSVLFRGAESFARSLWSEAARAVSWSTIPARLLAKSCTQHGANSTPMSQKWETSPKTVTPASITATVSGIRFALPISGRTV